MSKDALLSIDRCFEEMYLSATEDARHSTILSIDPCELKLLPIKQLLSKLHERMSHGKKKILKIVKAR